jgi:hypothetical protein
VPWSHRANLGDVSLCSVIHALRDHCSHGPRRPGYCLRWETF